MNRRIATGIGGVLVAALVPIGVAAIDSGSTADAPATVMIAAPATAPICLDSAGFGGVYCIWPEQPRRPARNAPPGSPAPPPAQNQPPPSN